MDHHTYMEIGQTMDHHTYMEIGQTMGHLTILYMEIGQWITSLPDSARFEEDRTPDGTQDHEPHLPHSGYSTDSDE